MISLLAFIVKHSAHENEKVTGGLVLPIAMLILWLMMSNPVNYWKKPISDWEIYSFSRKFRYFTAFILLIFCVIMGITNFIRYFFY